MLWDIIRAVQPNPRKVAGMTRSMKTQNKQKVLAINFGGIGDEILFLPTLKSIKAQMPDSHVTLLVEPRSQSIKRITNLVDAVVTFDIKKRPLYVADLIKLVGLLREGGYQTVVSSGSSKAVCVLLFLSGIEKRVGYHSGALSELLLSNPVPLNRNQYAGAMYHDLATGLGAPRLEAKDCTPEITVEAENLNRMTEFLHRTAGDTNGESSRKKVLIHPGMSKLALEKGLIKTWSVESWVQLIQLLSAEKDVQVLLAGGPDDKEIVEAILKTVAPSAPLISCVGATKDLADLAALIELSSVMVCVDSAPMHMAVGLGKPLVALFGPTDEKKLLAQDPRFTPLREPGSQPTYQTATANVAAPTDEPRRQSQAGPGVQLQPNIVFQSVLDQLKSASAQQSSPAHRR